MEKKITILAYTLFTFIGMFFGITSVAMIEISRTFKVDTAVINYVVTFFLIGDSLAIFISGYLLEHYNIKKGLIVAGITVLIGMAGIVLIKGLIFFGVFMFIAGLGVGYLVSASNYMIVNIYSEEKRRFKLNILNFFYGFGSILCPIAAGRILKANMAWEYIYLLEIVLIIGIIIFITLIDFSKVKHDKHEKSSAKIAFSINIILIAVALFFYVISEIILTTWVVTYLREYLMYEVVAASYALTFFWVFMSGGRLLSGILSSKIKLEKYIIGSIAISIISMVLFLMTNNIVLIYLLVSIAGLGFSGLYASILTYGTNQVKNVPPSLMTFYITLGAVGGLVSSPVSSFLKQNFDVKTAVATSPVVIAIAGICILLTLGGVKAIKKQVN